MNPDPADKPKRLAIIVFTGEFRRVHYALATAAAALAISVPVTLFFTMRAIEALRADLAIPGWQTLPTGEATDAATIDRGFRDQGVGEFEELLAACRDLGGRFLVCDMGLRAIGLGRTQLRSDLHYDEGGLVTFLRDAGADGSIIFV
ncbi:MAG: hypothetical protein FJX65_00410 [Alphaproteobacteria bacterium]|nr:hypothetical protein [Alphaproteobacteria bacterium]